MIILSPDQLVEQSIKISTFTAEEPASTGPLEVGVYRKSNRTGAMVEMGIAVSYTDDDIALNALVPVSKASIFRAGRMAGHLPEAAEDLTTGIDSLVSTVETQTGKKVVVPSLAPPQFYAEQRDVQCGDWQYITGRHTRMTFIERITGRGGGIIADSRKTPSDAVLKRITAEPVHLTVGPDADEIQVAAVSVVHTLNRLLAAEVVPVA